MNSCGKITDYVKATGRTTARPVLLLYYVLRSPETPSSDKMLICGTFVSGIAD